jgi:TolB-like protein
MMKLFKISVIFLFIISLIFSNIPLRENAIGGEKLQLEDGVKELADQISKSMMEMQGNKIAVIDFSDLNGNVTALGQFMAEELTTQIFNIASGKFEVMERRQLLKLEEELTLGQTGFIEEKSIKKMGQILGVDAIVTGSMTNLDNTIKINARLIGVESAKVFAVASTEISKTGVVAELMGKPAERKQEVTKSEAQSISQTQLGKAEVISGGKQVRLEEGNIIIIRNMETVKSDNLSPGSLVKMEVAEDVIVNGKVLIKANTPVLAEITSSAKSGAIGKAGKISLDLRKTKAVDEQNVFLRGNVSKEGESRMGASIATGIILCPLLLLIKGDATEIPSGATFKAYIDNSVMISVE